MGKRVSETIKMTKLSMQKNSGQDIQLKSLSRKNFYKIQGLVAKTNFHRWNSRSRKFCLMNSHSAQGAFLEKKKWKGKIHFQIARFL